VLSAEFMAYSKLTDHFLWKTVYVVHKWHVNLVFGAESFLRS